MFAKNGHHLLLINDTQLSSDPELGMSPPHYRLREAPVILFGDAIGISTSNKINVLNTLFIIFLQSSELQ
jgi:hypothetical protein